MKKGWRWFRLRKKGILRAILAGMILLVLAKALGKLVLPGVWERMAPEMGEMAKAAGQSVLQHIWEQFYPAPDFAGQQEGWGERESDPSYQAAWEVDAFLREHEYLEFYGNEETWEVGQDGSQLAMEDGQGKGGMAEQPGEGMEDGDRGSGEGSPGNFEAALAKVSFPGQTYQLAQLKDYDFLMSHFYNVHTSTTADRQLMDAEKLLKKDFGLYPEGEGQQGGPQILIYHTHSQEAFADSGEGESIVEVGTYLAKLLEEKGFFVYHDCSVYDVRDGKLDRNRAYTYALEGISRILEDNPSIQVVIDLHRDGVKEGTRLVAEVNGKPTAQIMFFNGLSQTPDGPVPYLENPNREDNLAFSLQLQLKAAAYYPGFARKIYLKGLRYNQHVRPCACLVEVGAQTNTFEEARNAMEPLAEVFTMVLRGN